MRVVDKLAHPDRKRLIEDVSGAIACGKVVIAPSDTCYGIYADAKNIEAVSLLKTIKGRSFDKPLSIMNSSMKMVQGVCDLTDHQSDLLSKYLPGRTTFVVKQKAGALDDSIGRDGTIGIRIPEDPFLIEVISSLKNPIVASSANPAGKPPIYKQGQILDAFLNSKVELIVLGGDIQEEPPTTVASLVGAQPKILRQGSVEILELVTQ